MRSASDRFRRSYLCTMFFWQLVQFVQLAEAPELARLYLTFYRN
nr:MAG TPA: hypothetical protein [Caudoviricetes sp.]